jgi:16S rRNA processing protein RimM
MDQAPDDWMLIGRVAGAFGVRGELKVELRTDFPERFNRLPCIYLGRERTRFQVERSRTHQGRPLLKLVGVDTPEKIDGLRGEDIFVPRSEAVPLPEGQYFLDDLIGMVVESADGERIGTISDVLRTGANDVYVVNEGRNAVLVPAIKDAILSLDVDARRVVVERWVLDSHE